MTGQNKGWMPAVAALGLLLAAAGLTLRAQDPREPKPERPSRMASGPSGSIQEALLKPFSFRFDKPTPLDQVAKQLARELGGPVVIDRAAIDRLGLKINDEIQLELEGVRLKTGLKLLLDQLDLTYKLVAEDNLLILTDVEGASEPMERVAAQLKEMHRDIHDLQDAVDDIHAALGLDEEGARLRKPTIIEEMPAPAGGAEPEKAKPKENPAPPAGLPRSRSGL